MLKCKVRIATYSRNSLISILDENVFCFVKVGKPSRQPINNRWKIITTSFLDHIKKLFFNE